MRNKIYLLSNILSFMLFSVGAWLVFVLKKSESLGFILMLLSAVLFLIFLFRVFRIIFQKVEMKVFILKLISILFAITVFVLVNVLVLKIGLQFDVTKNKQNSLKGFTKEIIGELNDPATVTVFYVGIPPKYIEDLLSQYQKQSKGLIKTEIVDPLVQIGYASKFGNVINSEEKKAIVQINGEKKEIDFTESSLTEERLTNALINASRKERKVYFLSGHNEYSIYKKKDTGLSDFINLLGENNIKSEELFLGPMNEVPKDCDVLVIAGAQNYLASEENQKIRDYLKRGGDALFLTENTVLTTPDKTLTEDEMKKATNLEDILTDWGVRVNYDVVVDLDSHASGDVGSPATKNYMAFKEIIRDLDYTFYVRPRSISLLEDRRKTLKLAPIVLTSSEKNSWGESDRTLNIKFDENIDKPGPVPIAYIIFEVKTGEMLSDTRIAVFSDADFLTNRFLKHYSNAQMGIKLINWLSESDFMDFVKEKKVEVPVLNLTSMQKRNIAFILTIMPLFVIFIGLLVWIKGKE